MKKDSIDFTPLSKLKMNKKEVVKDDEYENDDETEVKSAQGYAKFLNMLYKAKEDIHITHNVQKSKDLSMHQTLGALYEAFEDNIDILVETVFGIYGATELSFTTKLMQNPMEDLKMLYKQIESERKMFKESWIQNRIDNFQEQIALALYKLQYVTC
jgi:hypothetical protein